MASLVVTVIGDDRAGLVSALADVIAEHGGNWERSQMAELAGKFAGIVLVTVPDRSANDLVAGLWPLEEQGILDVSVQLGEPQPFDGVRFDMALIGGDRPGIVREISRALARLGVSIDQLSTATREAPMAGGMLFEASAVLELPAGTDVAAVRSAIEALANELMVDIDLSEGD